MSWDDDPHLPRATHPAEARAVLAQHLAGRRPLGSNQEDFWPGHQMRWITWGDTGRTSRASPPGGEETALPEAIDTLVQARYSRPLTWQVHLLLDARFGDWAATDELTIVWQFQIGCGKANISVPLTQNVTIVSPGPTAFNEFRAPYAAQTIQIQPASLTLVANSAGNRQMSWSAWVAPYVE